MRWNYLSIPKLEHIKPYEYLGPLGAKAPSMCKAYTWCVCRTSPLGSKFLHFLHKIDHYRVILRLYLKMLHNMEMTCIDSSCSETTSKNKVLGPSSLTAFPLTIQIRRKFRFTGITFLAIISLQFLAQVMTACCYVICKICGDHSFRICMRAKLDCIEFELWWKKSSE